MNLSNLNNESLWRKYSALFLFGLMVLILCGQLLAQLYTVKQFKHVTGVIIGKGVKVTGYSAGGRSRSGEPRYSLVITLDNRKKYNIDMDKDTYDMPYQLFLHETVTVYEPSAAYNILSLDGLDFGSRVSQVELLDGIVMYSFEMHQRKARRFMAFVATAMLLFAYALIWGFDED